MGKRVTEIDILAEMMAARLPDCPTGWYTSTEMARKYGISESAMKRKLLRGVEAGTYATMRAMARAKDGRIYPSDVFGLKPSK